MANEPNTPRVETLAAGSLELTTSPHSHGGLSTARTMWTVTLALLPCVVGALIFFGAGVLMTLAGAVAGAVGCEWAVNRLNRKAGTVPDGSAFLTGLLLGLILPPGFSPLFAALGGVVAIGIGKAVFGGLGANVFNPALVGRAFLQASFPAQMTDWSKALGAVDSVSSATPLGWLKFAAADVPTAEVTTSLSKLALGNIGGCIGETSAIAIVVGGLILLLTRVAHWPIAVSMLGGGLIFGGIFHYAGVDRAPAPLFHLLAGGYLFGAFFMATDYVTSPVTRLGQFVFGLGIAFFTVLIRIFGGLPEGVMYSILLMNATVPLINRWTRPTIYGAKR